MISKEDRKTMFKGFARTNDRMLEELLLNKWVRPKGVDDWHTVERNLAALADLIGGSVVSSSRLMAEIFAGKGRMSSEAVIDQIVLGLAPKIIETVCLLRSEGYPSAITIADAAYEHVSGYLKKVDGSIDDGTLLRKAERIERGIFE
jgi:hypothetical protein